MRRHLPKEVTYEDYAKFWTTLLHAERVQEECVSPTFLILPPFFVDKFSPRLDIHSYDMEHARLERRGAFFYLNVPGLAEKRPSVLRGDRIRLRPSNGGKWFEGAVTAIEQLQVGLRFHPSFKPSPYVFLSPSPYPLFTFLLPFLLLTLTFPKPTLLSISSEPPG